jgi:hypothetical protein
VDTMMPLMTDPQVFQAAGDLLFRNMDFPGADIIADRLAAMNPMSQIDPKSDIPPQAQMQLLQSQKTIADMQQQMMAMQLEIQNRGQVAQIREEGSSRRKLMDVISRAYNTDTINEAKINQANLKATTDQNKVELDAMLRLVLAGVPIQALSAEMARRDAEQQTQMAFAEGEVNDTANPFIQAGQEMMVQAAQAEQMQMMAAQQMAQQQQMPQAMPEQMPPEQPMV